MLGFIRTVLKSGTHKKTQCFLPTSTLTFFDQCLLQCSLPLVSQEVTEGSWANACLQFSRLSDHWLTQQMCLHHARPSTPQMIVFRFEGISNNNGSLSLSFTFLIPIRSYQGVSSNRNLHHTGSELQIGAD